MRGSTHRVQGNVLGIFKQKLKTRERFRNLKNTNNAFWLKKKKAEPKTWKLSITPGPWNCHKDDFRI